MDIEPSPENVRLAPNQLLTDVEEDSIIQSRYRVSNIDLITFLI